MQDRTGSDVWAEQADSDEPADEIKWGFGRQDRSQWREGGMGVIHEDRDIEGAGSSSQKKATEKTPA
jgi:hypothetical protein